MEHILEKTLFLQRDALLFHKLCSKNCRMFILIPISNFILIYVLSLLFLTGSIIIEFDFRNLRLVFVNYLKNEKSYKPWYSELIGLSLFDQNSSKFLINLDSNMFYVQLVLKVIYWSKNWLFSSIHITVG